ncbi:hypothetical protein [Geomonas anaerohicana]|uniref:Uncharacterized protein n=1 Tax=Geomonas anaerohicana TaxID=2798583 RepID=A0ABS0YFC1_9BACT|nr:hypothetical protein [Geomonas anaerohicana]MBJ6751002.1 hypothetical protein [Geomonas anaerohicana]
MKMMRLALVIVVLLAAPVTAAEQPSRDEQRQEPRRATPHPPRSPLRFTLVKGKERQSLEVTYLDPKTIAFKIAKSGTCNRHEHGKASIAGYWWLGAETDENEAGEAIAVQEYVYSKNNKCTINLRIDEEDWTQATIRESTDCSLDCHLSAESMHLRKQ